MGALDLFAKFNMDGRGFEKGAQKAESRAQRMRKKIGSAFSGMGAQLAGAVAVGAMVAKTKETTEWAARVRDLALQFGVTTGFVQKMDYAFKQTGGDSETAFKAMRKMALASGKLMNDLTTQLTKENLADAFEKVGISLRDVQSLNPEQMFLKVSSALKDADYSSAELQDAMNTIFGKSGSQLLVTFGNDLAGMAGDFEDMGGIVEEATINKLGAAADKLEQLGSRTKPIMADIAYGFVSAATVAGTALTAALSTFQDSATQFFLWLDKKQGKYKPNEAGEAAAKPLNDSFVDRYLDEREAQDAKEPVDEAALAAQKAHAADMKQIAADRVATAERLSALQSEAAAREMDKLPAAQKLAALEAKIAEEKQKQAELASQMRRSDNAAAAKARRDLAKAKEEQAALSGQHGDVSEITQVAGELTAAKAREDKIDELQAGSTDTLSGRDAFTEKDALAGVKGAQMDLAASVAENRGVDFAGIESYYAEMAGFRKKMAEAQAAGDSEEAAKYREGIERTTAQFQRDFSDKFGAENIEKWRNQIQAVKDAEAGHAARSAKFDAGDPAYAAAKKKLNDEELANREDIANAEARISAMRAKYGDEAVDAALAAKEKVAAAERKIAEEYAGARNAFAMARSEVHELETGESKRHGVDVVGAQQAIGASENDIAAAKRQIESIRKAQAEGMYQDGKLVASGTREEDGSISAGFVIDDPQAFVASHMAAIAKAEAKLAEQRATLASETAKQEAALADARNRAAQAGNKLKVMEAGSEQSQIEALESVKREEELKAQKKKLEDQEQKNADAEAKKKGAATPDAAKFKADQLARIGGALGGRNPVLDLQKRAFMLQKDQHESARQLVQQVRIITGN